MHDTPENETFSVWQFLAGDISEKVRERVPAQEAVEAAYHYTHNVAVMAGITQRVIIVDDAGSVVFEWLAGKGVVFPVQVDEPKRDYAKH